MIRAAAAISVWLIFPPLISQKMAEAVVEQLFHQFFCIVDLSNGGNGKASQVGMDNEGLGIKIREIQPMPKFPAQVFRVLLKLGTERGILDIVDGSLKSIFSHEPPCRLCGCPDENDSLFRKTDPVYSFLWMLQQKIRP